MRINQFVAAATGLSRRAADTAVAEGRITLNGQTLTAGTQVDEHQPILLDGRPITLPTQHTYVMLNKPKGYVCSRAQQGQAPTIYDLLPPNLASLRITGRLDRDSSGLVILTDDGAFIQRHTHPSHQKNKIYELKLSRPVTTQDQLQLETGVMLDDGPSRVTVLARHGRTIQVSLHEGRNRQLRRTFGKLGFSVERLHRLSIGPYQLGSLPSGQWLRLTPQERP